MKPTSQNTQTNVDLRYRTLLVLWFALFVSIGLYFFLSLIVGPENRNDSDIPPNTVLMVVLTTLGTLLVLLSFPVKRRFLERSVEQQDMKLVQTGLVFACAMCELSALLGFLESLLIHNRAYYLLFLLAAVGFALHFPRRAHLLAATYKTSWNGAAS